MNTEKPQLPPITKQILEMGAKLSQIPDDWDYQEEISNIILEKYGLSGEKKKKIVRDSETQDCADDTSRKQNE